MNRGITEDAADARLFSFALAPWMAGVLYQRPGTVSFLSQNESRSFHCRSCGDSIDIGLPQADGTVDATAKRSPAREAAA